MCGVCVCVCACFVFPSVKTSGLGAAAAAMDLSDTESGNMELDEVDADATEPNASASISALLVGTSDPDCTTAPGTLSSSSLQPAAARAPPPGQLARPGSPAQPQPPRALEHSPDLSSSDPAPPGPSVRVVSSISPLRVVFSTSTPQSALLSPSLDDSVPMAPTATSKSKSAARRPRTQRSSGARRARCGGQWHGKRRWPGSFVCSVWFRDR